MPPVSPTRKLIARSPISAIAAGMNVSERIIVKAAPIAE